jgi:hypothetical protein
MSAETVTSEFYTHVRCLRQGFQFIQENADQTIDVYPFSKRAFRAAKRSGDTADIEVARVQIIRQRK